MSGAAPKVLKRRQLRPEGVYPAETNLQMSEIPAEVFSTGIFSSYSSTHSMSFSTSQKVFPLKMGAF